MSTDKETRVVGLDSGGCVLVEEAGVVHATNESPQDFIDWYGLEDMDAIERRAIGIVIH